MLSSALPRDWFSAAGRTSLIGMDTLPPAGFPEPDDRHRAQRAREARAIEEGIRSIAEQGTIPFGEVVAWIESWDTPNELPPPEPSK